MPACPKQPPGYELYQQQKLCLIERRQAAPAAPGGQHTSTGITTPPGVCICQVPKFNCPVPGPQSSAPIAEIEMYMLHPPAPAGGASSFNLSAHDTGDLVGDTWFACADPSAIKFNDTLFTKTLVAVNTSFGPFARCTDLVPPPPSLRYLGGRG
eukprot:COSAG01_NODE_1066_length_11878_cov_244.494949_3_plen_154_part_00